MNAPFAEYPKQQKNFFVYIRELPNLLNAGHDGKRVLIRDSKVCGIYPDYESGLAQAYSRFGTEQGWILMQVDRRWLSYAGPRE